MYFFTFIRVNKKKKSLKCKNNENLRLQRGRTQKAAEIKTFKDIYLLRFLDSVSEERRLVLAVVKQDVERHLSTQHVVDGRLHHTVEVSGRERVIQHVTDLEKR